MPSAPVVCADRQSNARLSRQAVVDTAAAPSQVHARSERLDDLMALQAHICNLLAVD